MSHLTSLLLHFTWAVLLILVAWGWGGLILRRRLAFHSIFEEIFFASVVGLGLCVFFLSGLSLLGLFYRPVIALLLLGLLGLFPTRIERNGRWLLALILLASPVLWLTLYPPAGWDDISYHLPIAQSLLRHHRLIFDPYLRYPVFPINGELLFTLGLVLNLQVAQVVNWVCLFLLGLGCFATLEARFDRWAGILAFSALMSSQILLYLGSACYIDIQLALFVTAGILALTKRLQGEPATWVYLSGASLGLAAGIKYSALIFCLLATLLLLGNRRGTDLLRLGLTVALAGCPWYLRNYLLVGNPIWPFLSSLFGTGHLWNAVDYQGQFADFSHLGLAKTPLNFLSLPIYLTRSAEAGAIPLNPILWLGLFLFPFAKKKDWPLLFFVVGYTLCWFFSVNLPRYYVPNLALFSILATINFFGLIEQYPLAKNPMLILLIVLNLALPTSCLLRQARYRGTPPSNQSEIEAYLIRVLPTYPATRIAASLPGLTYALLNENLTLFGQGKLIGDWFGKARYSTVFDLSRDPRQLYRHLKGLGATHFLINKPRAGDMGLFFQPDAQFRREYEDPTAVLYGLEATNLKALPAQ